MRQILNRAVGRELVMDVPPSDSSQRIRVRVDGLLHGQVVALAVAADDEVVIECAEDLAILERIEKRTQPLLFGEVVGN